LSAFLLKTIQSERRTDETRGTPEKPESASRNSFLIPASQNDGDSLGFEERGY